jgi:hypothetical protein
MAILARTQITAREHRGLDEATITVLERPSSGYGFLEEISKLQIRSWIQLWWFRYGLPLPVVASACYAVVWVNSPPDLIKHRPSPGNSWFQNL